jgi:Protein of unknown function (DUF4232)
VKKALLAMPLLAVGVLAAGCSSSSSPAAAPPASAAASSTAAGAASSSSAATSGAASAVASSGATDVQAAAATCTSADLQVSLGGGAGAGMSQNHTGLQLRNTGSSPCTLYGYPGVSWVAGADGHQVGAAAKREANNGGGAEKLLTLAPGALASAPIDIVDAAVIPTSQCKPVPVRGLRVYPPGERAALFLSLPTASGGYGECSAATQDPTLTIGYLQLGPQPD